MVSVHRRGAEDAEGRRERRRVQVFSERIAPRFEGAMFRALERAFNCIVPFSFPKRFANFGNEKGKRSANLLTSDLRPLTSSTTSDLFPLRLLTSDL
jgi:hypothetical protein